MDESVVVRFGDWIGEGWRMFVEQWQAWVLNALIYFGILAVPIVPLVIAVFVISGVASAFTQSSMTYSTTTVTASNPDMSSAIFLGLFLFEAVVAVVLVVIGAYFTAGLYRTALKQLRGQKVQVSDLFSGGRFFFRLVGANILIGILTIIGFMLCIIPAFIVAGLFYFTGFLIVDQDLGVIDAMRKSYELCKNNFLWFTLFAFVVGLINQAGSSVCYVGLLATLPLSFAIGAVAYRDCFNIPGMKSFRADVGQAAPYGAPTPSFLPPAGSPPPPPNYSGYAGAQPPPNYSSYAPGVPQQPPASVVPPTAFSPSAVAPSNFDQSGGEAPTGQSVEPGATSTPSESGQPPADVPPSAGAPPSPVPPPAPVVPDEQLNSCPGCGKSVAPTARFCTSCGTPIPR
jgi:uncharacterized membrane protein